MDQQKPKLLLTVKEAAELCSISITLAYRLIRKGTWKAIKVNNDLRVSVDWLNDWIAEEMKKAA